MEFFFLICPLVSNDFYSHLSFTFKKLEYFKKSHLCSFLSLFHVLSLTVAGMNVLGDFYFFTRQAKFKL